MKNYPSVMVKAGRYSGEQREFLDAYMRKLLELGFCEDMATASWQAARLLVQKRDSRTNFRLSIALRPVNAATVKESWSMPHLDSEILNFQGSTCFAVLDFSRHIGSCHCIRTHIYYNIYEYAESYVQKGWVYQGECYLAWRMLLRISRV